MEGQSARDEPLRKKYNTLQRKCQGFILFICEVKGANMEVIELIVDVISVIFYAGVIVYIVRKG